MLRRAVRDVDPSLQILFAADLRADSIPTWISGSFVRARHCSLSFGALALVWRWFVLGVEFYSVARRTREIGIRMDGCSGWSGLENDMREGPIMLVSGIAIGLLLAIATARILSGILYRVMRLIRSLHGCSISSRYRRANSTGFPAARNTDQPDSSITRRVNL